MRSEVKAFTSEEITALLDAGGNFRKFNDPNGRRWLTEMLAGRWIQGHPAPIVLNKRGNILIDGQHRLWAAREYEKQTGKRIKFLVIWADQDAESISLSIDGGKKRTIADYLRHEGVENATAVASCLAIAARVKDGKLRATTFDNASALSPSEMVAIFEADKARIVEAVNLAVACNKTVGNVGLLAGCAYLIQKKNRHAARIFFNRLAKQTGLEEGDPILRLLQYFQEHRGEGTRRAVVRRAMHAAVVIKAWNAWVTGERPKTLRLRILGDRPEEFPQVEKGDPHLFSE